jgi:hypothetical protein
MASRRDNRTNSGPQKYTLFPVLFLAALIMPILCLRSDSPLYSSIGGAAAMLGINLLVPACRPARPYLSPYNWALALFGLVLVIVPANIMVAGVKPVILPYLPSAHSIEYAYLLSALGYLSFSLAYWLTSRHRTPRGFVQLPWALTKTAALIYVLIGALGMVLAFSATSALDYYTSAPKGIVDPQSNTTLAGAASTFLRPFLAFGAVAIWSHSVDAKLRSRFALIMAGLACACVTTVVFLSYGYNRATVAAPIVCLVAVVNRHVRKLPLWLLFCTGSALLLTLMFIGQYRKTGSSLDELLNDKGAVNNLTTNIDISEQLQLYSSAPQFTAYLLEASQWGEGVSAGQTLVASLMFIVPILGKPFRPDSGVALYNSLIYGNSTTLDQPIPFAGELFINFRLLGIILGYALIGFLIRRLQDEFEDTASSLKTFSLIYLTIWLCYSIHSSAMVVSQMLLYFCLPIYGVSVARWLGFGPRPVSPMSMASPNGRGCTSAPTTQPNPPASSAFC